MFALQSKVELRVWRSPRLPLHFVGAIAVLLAIGCSSIEANSPQDSPGNRAGRGETDAPVAVNLAVAKANTAGATREYTGTTRPFREISLRSQVEGQILSISADVGDRVTEGQTLARLDGRLLAAATAEAVAEVSAREVEVAQAQAERGEAIARVEQARLELEQAELDFSRFDRLADVGALPQQDADAARTAVGTAKQALRAAQEQVAVRERAIAAARRRVTAQQAIVTQERQRETFTTLTAPASGRVIARAAEPGDLAQPGSDILTIGDFSQLEVLVRVSELALENIREGQGATVRLDAFPNRQFSGRVTRLSPAADPVARLVPVEIVMANPDGRIGSGLLARVSFAGATVPQVTIPLSALAAGQERQRGNAPSVSDDRVVTLFVARGEGEEVTVQARTVQLGDRANGRAVVLAGLAPGDRYVTRSSGPLADGDRVRPSFLSEPPAGDRSSPSRRGSPS